ncbi:hypothetical protein SUGI_0074190 [Cryptomeria japonica]|nr:hypothetical protein SUGI_0074190 [Cryptomeria japonica]
MAHYFGVSCMCGEETLEEQCERLFDTDVEGQDAIRGLMVEVLSGKRHCCDGYVYKEVLTILVDILTSKEKCIV